MDRECVEVAWQVVVDVFILLFESVDVVCDCAEINFDICLVVLLGVLQWTVGVTWWCCDVEGALVLRWVCLLCIVRCCAKPFPFQLPAMV